MRVFVYVDGFNLYYRALKNTPYKWLNLVELSKRLAPHADDTVEAVRYFTARVSARSGSPDAPRKQQIYLSALGTLPDVEIHYGKFLPKTKRRPLVADPTRFVEIHDTEEKGSDVNLAVHLLNDGWQKKYDVALVLSQDTDLIEPIRMVTRDLNLKVGLVQLDGGRPNRDLAQAASFIRHVKPGYLRSAQFPGRIRRVDGSIIEKPMGW
ncbi:MAG: NYN domain-containing protein [Parvibaculum sp.]